VYSQWLAVRFAVINYPNHRSRKKCGSSNVALLDGPGGVHGGGQASLLVIHTKDDWPIDFVFRCGDAAPGAPSSGALSLRTRPRRGA
jgi:hypothetical protein